MSHCLIGEQSTYPGERRASKIVGFSSTVELRDWLQGHSSPNVNAVFHVAAVSDFMFGRIWSRSSQGDLTEVKAGKNFHAAGNAPGRNWCRRPKSSPDCATGFRKRESWVGNMKWMANRQAVIAAAGKQVHECLTDACVANGPAYGDGYGVVRSNGKHVSVPDAAQLFETLEKAHSIAAEERKGREGRRQIVGRPAAN